MIPEYQEPPSPEKRALLNTLLLGAVALPTAGLLGPYAASFVPRRYASITAGFSRSEQAVVGGLRSPSRHGSPHPANSPVFAPFVTTFEILL